ncbi:MAG: response regulator transcription factor [Betaproteobacteria bacterium]|nr:response regulator transcription factor [Betaproteobacteria bacterium]
MDLFIVEDSIPVRDRLVRTLEGLEGLDIVGTAEDVTAAIAGLENNHPDALILDLQLPSGSGLQVLRAVREKLPAMRVIVMTNFAAEPYRKAAMAAGAEVFLDKSAEFARVRDILSEWRDQADHRPLH